MIWNQAAMIRCKKLPTLDQVIGGKPQQVIQSADQIRGVFARMRALAAAEERKGAA